MRLYRVVSRLGGGAEGKYFWERLDDARKFALGLSEDPMVCATYEEGAAEQFHRWEVLDGLGPARFAEEQEMNLGLMSIEME